jgi:hypothetical protein
MGEVPMHTNNEMLLTRKQYKPICIKRRKNSNEISNLIARNEGGSKTKGTSYTWSDFLGCKLEQPNSNHHVHR